MDIKTKAHRLPEMAYRGVKAVSFTACIERRLRPFGDSELVGRMVEVLGTSAESAKCVIPVYCFMPDHVHLLVQGVSPASRLKVAMDQFKRRSGELLAQRFPGIAWQRNYHDHIIRHSDDLSAHVAYILNNPVRAGLVGGLV